ncbi:hypothetical protein [Sphingomonas profundi]|uniref:hypothetical protein n=1 Tax=Alterirhizorhabdus profundi TaxID=2681549 RepID=UPI0018D12E94|nr:hypothetical protein [Sphingomonas profundi]
MRIPGSMQVVEVGPRDGLQSLGLPVSTDAKLKMIEILARAGLGTIEVTGFAHPAKIPQFADAEALCERLPRHAATRYRAMAPNARGAARAVATQVDEVLGLVTASAAYSARNQNMTIDAAVGDAIVAARLAERANKDFCVAIGLAFWCAYEGTIPPDRVLGIIGRFHDAGVRRLYLAATVGLESPAQVSALFERALDRFPDLRIGFHVHNLGGRAAALALAAIDAGAAWIEGAICGIGGGIAMPASMAATGNYATEDLVCILDDCGVDTGLDQAAVVAAARKIATLLGIEPRSFAANGAWREEIRRLS